MVFWISFCYVFTNLFSVEVPMPIVTALLGASRAVGSLCAGAGMAVGRALIESGRVIASLDAVTYNWPAFREIVMTRTVAELASACGVGPDEVRRLADIYRCGEPGATLIGWVLQCHIFGAENVRFINALALLSGQIGLPGGGSYYIAPFTRHLEQENLNPSYFHDFINYARPAFTPPAGARSDHWILTEVGRRLNPPIRIPPLEELMAASLPTAAGIGLEELRRRLKLGGGINQIIADVATDQGWGAAYYAQHARLEK